MFNRLIAVGVNPMILSFALFYYLIFRAKVSFASGFKEQAWKHIYILLFALIPLIFLTAIYVTKLAPPLLVDISVLPVYFVSIKYVSKYRLDASSSKHMNNE